MFLKGVKHYSSLCPTTGTCIDRMPISSKDIFSANLIPSWFPLGLDITLSMCKRLSIMVDRPWALVTVLSLP